MEHIFFGVYMDPIKSAVCLDDLPESILLEIFTYFKFRDLCRCAGVSKRWNRIAKDRSIQKKIDISNVMPSVEQFKSLVNSYCTGEVIDFRMRTLKSDKSFLQIQDAYTIAISTLVQKSPNLQKLSMMYIENVHPSDLFVLPLKIPVLLRAFPMTVEIFPKTILHLSLRDSVMFPDVFFGSSPAKYLPHLQCLDVGRVSSLTSIDIGVFSNFRSLRTLYLDGCSRINNGGIDHITDILPRLCVLDLEGTDVSNDGVSCILETCANIKELFIGQTAVTSDAFFNIRKNIASHLGKLCIRNTQISGHAINTFVTQSFVGKKFFLITSWLDGIPECLTSRPSCHIINYSPELAYNALCDHFNEHVC